jgi:hypothetical protein
MKGKITLLEIGSDREKISPLNARRLFKLK